MNIVNDIQYPCYIGSIPKNSTKNSEELDSYKIFYYDTGTIKYIYDAIPSNDYNNCDCDLYYYERIGIVRALCNFNRSIDLTDLPMIKCFSAIETTDYIQQGLYEDNDGFVVMSVDGQFDLNDMKQELFWEIKR